MGWSWYFLLSPVLSFSWRKSTIFFKSFKCNFFCFKNGGPLCRAAALPGLLSGLIFYKLFFTDNLSVYGNLNNVDTAAKR